MGTENNNISNYIYKVNENTNNLEKTGYYSIFEKSPFEQGEYRYCYKGGIRNNNGKLEKPENFPNGQCVVKVFKSQIAKDVESFDKDFNNIFYSIKVSRIFNSCYSYQCRKLNFVSPYATSIFKHATFELFGFISIKDDDATKKIKEGEWLYIEPFLEGEFQKYVSNTCWMREPIDKTFPFFLHWNWVYSKGEKIVSDIQGVKKTDCYELTDPAVQSIKGDYGPADLGYYGLIIFLLKHQHNSLCEELPWPTGIEIQKLCLKFIPVQRTIFNFEIIRKNLLNEEFFQKKYYSEYNNNKYYYNQIYDSIRNSVFSKENHIKKRKKNVLFFKNIEKKFILFTI